MCRRYWSREQQQRLRARLSFFNRRIHCGSDASCADGSDVQLLRGRIRSPERAISEFHSVPCVSSFQRGRCSIRWTFSGCADRGHAGANRLVDGVSAMKEEARQEGL
jgi:hypothetical protein